MAYQELDNHLVTFLSSPPCPPTHSTPATWASSLLSFKHTMQLTPGPLHWLFSLPKIFFPRYYIAPPHPSGIYSNTSLSERSFLTSLPKTAVSPYPVTILHPPHTSHISHTTINYVFVSYLPAPLNTSSKSRLLTALIIVLSCFYNKAWHNIYLLTE